MTEKISIIIPCKKIDSQTKKCILECLKLDYSNFEIIVLPDNSDKVKYPKIVKIISTGLVKPSIKRNIAMDKSNSEFFAFIDSDAYPKKDWLKNAIKYFKNDKIGIVGGPNLTPSEGNFWEKISGYTLSNFFVSGKASIRYKISNNQFVTELPSCNYITRNKAAEKYDSNFLTAEDTKFCFSARKKGYKILYANDVIVFHHRRDSLKKHLKQMFVYGRDNLWLLKKEFSINKLHFLITLIGIIGFLLGIIFSFFNPVIRIIFPILITISLFMILFTSIHKSIKITFFVFITSVLTLFAHGLGSLYGLISK